MIKPCSFAGRTACVSCLLSLYLVLLVFCGLANSWQVRTLFSSLAQVALALGYAESTELFKIILL